MNRKLLISLVVVAVALVGVPQALALPAFLDAFKTVYTDGTCGTCHVNPAGGGARNSYGMLFESQPNHDSDPVGALKAIGPAPNTTLLPTATPTTTVTGTPTVTVTGTPTATITATTTATAIVTATATPRVTATATPRITTTVTATATPRVTATGTPRVTQTPSGPTPVPEFPTLVLPIAAVIGLMTLLLYRRR